MKQKYISLKQTDYDTSKHNANQIVINKQSKLNASKFILDRANK